MPYGAPTFNQPRPSTDEGFTLLLRYWLSPEMRSLEKGLENFYRHNILGKVWRKSMLVRFVRWGVLLLISSFAVLLLLSTIMQLAGLPALIAWQKIITLPVALVIVLFTFFEGAMFLNDLIVYLARRGIISNGWAFVETKLQFGSDVVITRSVPLATKVTLLYPTTLAAAIAAVAIFLSNNP